MTPSAWHERSTLREEVKTGALTMAEFAADLYGVRTGDAPEEYPDAEGISRRTCAGDALEVYRDAEKFFSRTHPTHRLKELARDVLQRLAGTGGKPVMRIQVAYGGGKTHTLIALMHLAERGAAIVGHPTVQEFLAFARMKEAPQARVALLPFDKLDVHEGMEVVGPDGGKRRVMTPWGALAYQLAGDAGFARVQAHEANYTAPAQPLLEELLRAPIHAGLAALVLVDEAVIYGRQAVNFDHSRLGTLKDFFQMLTQAVVAVNRACIVASLIASDSEADDRTGAQVLRALEDAFGRLQETYAPVGREDLAEVLRRRLFERVLTEDERRPVVDTYIAAYHPCKYLRDSQKDNTAYDRLLRSYPFHPDLLEVSYEKWTELPRFQRTRGAFRLMAQALQQGNGRDDASFVGVEALLGDVNELSPALTELVRICSQEQDNWTPKLSGELERAREVQTRFRTLRRREIEQAVLATFLHSQPTGQKADPADLYALLVHPEADLAALESGLAEWRNLSWFLTEETTIWRLTTQPNLTHMQVQALSNLKPERVEEELRQRIGKINDLAEADDGVVTHRLPQTPADVADNMELHYLVLSPECAVEPGKPIPKSVEQYFTTTSGLNNPRTYKNGLIALAPDQARLHGLRRAVAEYLAWVAVETGEGVKHLAISQRKTLAERKRAAEEALPDAVRATYSVVVDLGEDGNVRAQALKSGESLDLVDTRPFPRIKAMLTAEERLVAGVLAPELLLADSYYQLWAPGETSKRAEDLLAAFFQFARLPRFLRSRIFRETLAAGCRDGHFALRLPRPDGTARVLWRVAPADEELLRVGLEVVPVEHSILSEVPGSLLTPGKLDGLWPTDSQAIRLREIFAYFNGKNAPRAQAESVVTDAVSRAVESGFLWLRNGSESWYHEPITASDLDGDVMLCSPPAPIPSAELSPSAIPEAWADGESTVKTLFDSVSGQRGYPVPWGLVRSSVEAALQTRLFEVEPTGATWPCAPADAARVRLRLPDLAQLDPADLVGPAADAAWTSSSTTLGAIRETIEKQRGRKLDDKLFAAAVDAAVSRGLIVREGASPGYEASIRVRRRATPLTAEGTLTAFELQKMGELVSQLSDVAPTLRFNFHLLITVEDQQADPGTCSALNDILAQASPKLRLG